jgi:hypothetical protein
LRFGASHVAFAILKIVFLLALWRKVTRKFPFFMSLPLALWRKWKHMLTQKLLSLFKCGNGHPRVELQKSQKFAPKRKWFYFL